MNETKSYDLVVSVGTDHHLFNRLIDWIDSWAAEQPDAPAAFVQHGASRAAAFGTNRDRLPRAELLEIYRNAQVVVVQGGPGSILDVREVGVIPLAVPRVPELKEVVDGHQIEFTRVMAEHGNAVFVDSEEELHRMIDEAFANPADFRTEPRVAAPQAAGDALATALDKVRVRNDRSVRTLFRKIRQIATGK